MHDCVRPQLPTLLPLPDTFETAAERVRREKVARSNSVEYRIALYLTRGHEDGQLLLRANESMRLAKEEWRQPGLDGRHHRQS